MWVLLITGTATWRPDVASITVEWTISAGIVFQNGTTLILNEC